MTKSEYLKLCIQNRCYTELSWLVGILGIISDTKPSKYLDITYTASGYSYLDSSNQLVRISDALTQPLFTPTEKITIDSTWTKLVSEPTETTVGRLLANMVCLYEAFNTKLPYINKKFTVSTIESIVAPKLNSNPTDDNYDPNLIYVRDYIKFVDNVQYLSNLSSVVVISATPKIITKPEGLEEFIAQLVIKYKGKLSSPVELANFETELKDFDDKYLKDDPAYGIFISGKVKNIARKKLFLTIGAELDFEEKATVEPIISSLADGWNLNTKEFRLMMNGTRYGSFSRGAETVKGGVTFKTLIRATNNLKIVEADCGTKLTLPRTYYQHNIHKLVDRSIVIKGTTIPIETLEQAKQYLDQPVQLRSAAYCKLEGDRICSTCAGKKISHHKDSLAILLSEISAIILTAALKKMHGTVLSTAKIDLNKHFT